MPQVEEETARTLKHATAGFDCVFSNDLQGAREIFASADSPFHLLGLGVCAFLEAALGMEVGSLVFSESQVAPLTHYAYVFYTLHTMLHTRTRTART